MWLGQPWCWEHLGWPLFVQHVQFIRSRTNNHINSHKLRNLCLFAHDCLFDIQSIQSVVCLIIASGRDHPFRRLIKGVAPPKFIARSLAISLSKFCVKFLDPPTRFKNYLRVGNSSTQDVPCSANSLALRRNWRRARRADNAES